MKLGKWKILIYALVFLGTFVILGLSGRNLNDRNCEDMRITVVNEVDNQFLDSETIRNMVRDFNGAPLEDSKMGEIKVAEIEQFLKENSYVKEAQVYKDISGILMIDVELKRPVARVYDNAGNGFYLDQDFRKVPLSKSYSANVILVRGDFTETVQPFDTLKSESLVDLTGLLNYIDEDEFRRSMFSELIVDENGDITFYPSVGDIEVIFGKPENIETKFTKLKTFYSQVLNRVGWNKYNEIDLRFEEQVVARK